MRCVSLLGAVASLLAWTSASAQEPGVPITVRVVDSHGYPVPTASVRFPVEGDRHSVNSVTGEWRGSVLYLSRGRELVFEPGVELRFQVNAPGYLPFGGRTTVEKRRNVLIVELDPMEKVGTCDSRPLSRKCRTLRYEHTPPVFATAPPDDFELNPETMYRLGELRDPDPELSAAFSAHLLSLGPEYAALAGDWAEHASKEASVLSGSDFVEVMDEVYEVRAKAASSQWQSEHYARIADPSDWKSLHRTNTARRRAAVISAEWAEWAVVSGTDADTALKLCLSAADAPGRCF